MQVLGVLVCFFGSSLWHTRSTLGSHADEVSRLVRKLRSTESQEKHHRNVASQLEARNRQLEGSLADATRDLRMRDMELTTLDGGGVQAVRGRACVRWEGMLAELAQHEETRNAAQTGGFAHAHTMPQQEPLHRDEAEFKPRAQAVAAHNAGAPLALSKRKAEQ
ncbi:hypothetical protein DUNSADRAFT_12559 [Dunaliella salina]|uniref:Uncharacterized protein n=1 Tax=Dunaliella salina TaxID=3046 RepID=A0ABQ7GB30_DUNSA|nr:hypothetical protein DUNSADRAFT_12559 [Dunaliella salina]|eukprot:KAF5831813.1 hypothetical protein DUNSADRAFT_12559 [Dunaliella salina]